MCRAQTIEIRKFYTSRRLPQDALIWNYLWWVNWFQSSNRKAFARKKYENNCILNELFILWMWKRISNELDKPIKIIGLRNPNSNIFFIDCITWNFRDFKFNFSILRLQLTAASKEIWCFWKMDRSSAQ